MNYRKLIIFFFIFVVTACSQLNTQDQLERLTTSLNQYGAALRWDRIREAHSFHLSRDNKQPEIELDKIEKFSVSSFKVLEQNMYNEASEADLLVEIGYYDEQVGTLRKLKQSQYWWYKPELKRWFTEADFPSFK